MNLDDHWILIVDDNLDWCLTFYGMLKEAGLFSIYVTSIPDAISKLEAQKIDLALLDIRLDESDEENDAGIKLAEEINLRWPTIKIVFATGYANDDFVKRTMIPKNGKKRLAVNFVRKQKIDDLVDVIQKALE
jgi:CheY-like chemotaxis protein